MKKAVLLHPLNERGKQDCERGLAKFFESLRPAQDQAPPGGGARERNL